jgi:UDP-N-acetylmuramate: L-alanyl-gamma-D-glutamyl-meso-diaminopimelate ligase
VKVHFIAIGGSAMHNLAIALHLKGYEVTGSDDQIFEPSASRLAARGLLPQKEGWFPEKIHDGLGAVILGMHAKADNPELLKARELGLKIYSYPEFLYEQSKNKKRVVIGGSHGKTTITSMILHVLQYCGVDADYMVGAQLEGFEVMVKLDDTTDVIILEGDEYLSSPMDLRPKFHLYKPHIALISGIAWDHVNVFPTFEGYVDQFRIFVETIEHGGTLIFCSEDPEVVKVCNGFDGLDKIPYGIPEYKVKDGQTIVMSNNVEYSVNVFGRHNLLNINGARLVCNHLGIEDNAFYTALQTFKGASKRLEKVEERDGMVVYKDFAHAPSKVKATTQAVREQHADKIMVACLELHTYSSLSEVFLPLYKGSLDGADLALVFFDHHALKLKRLPDLDKQKVAKAFDKTGVEVFTETTKLQERLKGLMKPNTCFLMMSSGNFGGIDVNRFFNDSA